MDNRHYYAAIDLGTNSCRLVIADDEGKYLCTRNVKTALGEGMYKEMKFTPEAFARGVDCLCAFKDEIRRYTPCKLRAVATAGCRMAKNADDFLISVKERAGIELEVIDGVEEARLNLKGAVSHARGKAPYVLLYDLGGGSTEITLAENNDGQRIIYTISIPWGARNASEAFVINDYDEQSALALRREVEKYIRVFIDGAEWEKYKNACCCIATSSSPLRLAAMIKGTGKYDRQEMDGVKMSAEDMDRQIAMVYGTTEKERAASPYIGSKRATIFIAACVIFQMIYQKLELKEVIASLKSAKDGIIEELREEKWPN